MDCFVEALVCELNRRCEDVPAEHCFEVLRCFSIEVKASCGDSKALLLTNIKLFHMYSAEYGRVTSSRRVLNGDLNMTTDNHSTNVYGPNYGQVGQTLTNCT